MGLTSDIAQLGIFADLVRGPGADGVAVDVDHWEEIQLTFWNISIFQMIFLYFLHNFDCFFCAICGYSRSL